MFCECAGSGESLPSSISFTISFKSGRLVKRPISSFSESVMPYSCGPMKSKRILLELYSSLSFSRRTSCLTLLSGWCVSSHPVKRLKYDCAGLFCKAGEETTSRVTVDRSYDFLRKPMRSAMVGILSFPPGGDVPVLWAGVFLSLEG